MIDLFLRKPMLPACMLLPAFLICPASASAEERDWSMGVYADQYYDTEPAGFSQGKADYLNQYLVALTASKTLWRAQTLPLSLEMDGVIGFQFGLASLQEIAVAPAARWSGFPWNETASTLERGQNGNGKPNAEFLFCRTGIFTARD